jgi:hypothetical protein
MIAEALKNVQVIDSKTVVDATNLVALRLRSRRKDERSSLRASQMYHREVDLGHLS